METNLFNVSPECEIVSSRIFSAPRETVFNAWTNPDLLAQWWGPAGFTNTFYEFNPMPGGKWRFTMHGPEKGHYENEATFLQVEAPKLIAWDRITKPLFRVVTTFDETADGNTHLIFRMQFASKEECDKVRNFVPEKNEENFDRLERVLGVTKATQIQLRPSVQADLEYFFRFQLDEEAMYLAAFTPKDPTDKAAYFEKFTRLLQDPTIHMQTILVGDAIVGSVAKFIMEGDAEITYWIDKNFWGKGVATAALSHFLTMENTRPIFARVAFDNMGSQRVLEKCGFVSIGKDKGFANARQAEIEEFIYRLG